MPEVRAAISQMLAKHVPDDDNTESTTVVHGFDQQGKPVLRTEADTQDYMKEKFSLWPGDRAIIHTHPMASRPDPSANDRAVADKYGLKMYSVSKRGLYLYDPAVKKTTQVYSGTDYLNPKK